MAEKRREPDGRRQLARTGSDWFPNPFASMRRLSDDMERLFDSMRGGRPQAWHDFGFDGGWLPDIEVLEEEGHLVVRTDVPGMSKDDVTVTIGDDTLTIEGERKLDTKAKGKDYYRSERAYGHFRRCLGLPEGIDLEKAAASFKDGVLEVRMPAPKSAGRPGRRLEIAGE